MPALETTQSNQSLQATLTPSSSQTPTADTSNLTVLSKTQTSSTDIPPENRHSFLHTTIHNTMRTATTLGAVTLDYGASVVEITGNILAILGGATAALSDATKDTAAQPEKPGSFEYDLNLVYEPSENATQQPEGPVTLCSNALNGTFPIDSIGGLAITQNNLGWSAATTLIGLLTEYAGHRISYATRKATVNQLVRDTLVEHLTKSRTQAKPASSNQKTADHALRALTNGLRQIGQVSDPVGKLLVKAGLGFWVLQQGLGGTPYQGLNDLTLMAEHVQPIAIPFASQACTNSNFPDPTARFEGVAEGYILFPEVFTQKLSATPIITALLLSGLSALLLGKLSQHITDQIKLPEAVRDTLAQLPPPDSEVELWRESSSLVANKILSDLTQQGLISGAQMASVEATITDAIADHFDQMQNTDIERGTGVLNGIQITCSPKLQGLGTFFMDILKPMGPMPVRPENPKVQAALFMGDVLSKLGTVALMASYIARTLSDGIPYLSTGFDGVPAGAESTLPLNRTEQFGESISLYLDGSVTIPQFSLQNFQTNWFVPLIVIGLSTKLINSVLVNSVRLRTASNDVSDLAAKWQETPPEKEADAVNQNQKLTLDLLKKGAITDAAAQGFLPILSHAPIPWRWFSITPYEKVSLDRIKAQMEINAKSGTENCVTKTAHHTKRALEKLGNTGNELSHAIFSVLSSYAIGIALVSQIFESWATHGKIAADDPGGSDLNITGTFSTQDPAVTGLLLGTDVNCTWLPRPKCQTEFSVNSGFAGAELEEYDIPNPSLVTGQIRTLGLLVGIPAVALALWWGRKLGSLGTQHAYSNFQQRQPSRSAET